MTHASQYNPDRRIQETPLPQAPQHGMIASGILIVISGVALGIILATNPTAAGSFTQIATFGTIGGVSLLTLVICTALTCRNKRRQTREREDIHRQRESERREFERQEADRQRVGREQAQLRVDEERLRQAEDRREGLALLRGEDVREVVDVESVRDVARAERSEFDTFREDVMPNLLDAFGRAVVQVTQAHARLTGKGAPSQREVEALFAEAKELMALCLDKPELYLAELVRCFGRGKNKPSVGLRRLVAAHNGGNEVKLQEVLRQNTAIERGNNLALVARRLHSRESNAAILAAFPEIMDGHFSIDDEFLHGIGGELLRKIFERMAGNRTIDQALTQLRRNAPPERCTKKEMEAFTKEVEAFMKLAFAEARIPRREMEEMSARFIEHMIANQLMQNVEKMLGMVARNIRLLPSMFADSVDPHELFPQIDETFLLSESSDCLGETEEMQAELIRLQSAINYDRPEAGRVAFLVLDPADDRRYQTLYDNNEVVRMCFDANRGNYDLEELARIGNRRDVQVLGRKWDKRILVVPVSISDHPFKQVRSALNKVPNWLLRTLYTVFKGFIPGLVKPGIQEILPALEPREQQRFDRFVDSMLGMLMRPIYDGSINNSSEFRRPFEAVITGQGEQLANRLEGLVNNQGEPLTFEGIREVWVEEVDNVAQGYQDL